jgi:hypothetical protein
VKSIAWPFSVVDAEHVVPFTITMPLAAGSHRHPSGPASGSVLQHTGGSGGAASCLAGCGFGLAQPAAARSVNRTPIEERMAATLAASLVTARGWSKRGRPLGARRRFGPWSTMRRKIDDVRAIVSRVATQRPVSDCYQSVSDVLSWTGDQGEPRASFAKYLSSIPRQRGEQGEFRASLVKYLASIPRLRSGQGELRASLVKYLASIPQLRSEQGELRASLVKYLASIPQLHSEQGELRASLVKYLASIPQLRSEQGESLGSRLTQGGTMFDERASMSKELASWASDRAERFALLATLDA